MNDKAYVIGAVIGLSFLATIGFHFYIDAPMRYLVDGAVGVCTGFVIRIVVSL